MKTLAIALSVMTLACASAARTKGIAERGKEPVMSPMSETEKMMIQEEVRDQFAQLISALNRKDARAWSEFFSEAGFLSAFAGADYYATRSAWVDKITSYFEARASQHVEPVAVHVTALAPDAALMTSQETCEMRMKNGQTGKSSHVFTMIWKREKSGWKILHSHESWVDEPVK